MDPRQYTEDITRFINAIGIDCNAGFVPEQTFLPGINIENGCILYDPDQLKYPGDLLHEAGHLAVLLPNDRKTACTEKMNGDLSSPAVEMSAIAWSWAAAGHLDIPPDVLFHKDGYKGGSSSLIENFSAGKYVGVPVLAWLGMTCDPANKKDDRMAKYPNMKHWLRQ